MHFLQPGREIADYRDCHSFQAAILEIGLSMHDEKRAGLALRAVLDVPVTIGLSAPHFDICGLKNHPNWVDAVLADVQSTKLLKSQCDALIRLAHKLAAEELVSRDVTLPDTFPGLIGLELFSARSTVCVSFRTVTPPYVPLHTYEIARPFDQ